MVTACCILSVSYPLEANEACISCDKPVATYRCTFEQSARDRKLQLGDVAQAHICENVLEKAGPHGSCKIVEGTQPCDGTPRTVTVADYQKFVASDGHSTYQQGVLEKAQQGVSSTWDCLASFFGKC
jgi:hypothetical protein